MSTPAIPPAKEKNFGILPELPPPHDDTTKSSNKRDSLSPQSLPARNSSLQKSRKSEKNNNNNNNKMEKSLNPVPQEQTDDKPPTPPPKPQRRHQPPPAKTVAPVQPKKKKMGFIERLTIALATCCQPSSARDSTGKRETVEMESVQKEQVSTTTSDKESDTPKRTEDNRPTVTIAPDVMTEKEANGQTRIVTPTILPSHSEYDEEMDETISTDEETRERERALRESISIQAPYPPTSDELQQSEAVVVSPTPQISLTSTESEESESEETIPRPLTQIIDEPQPRVVTFRNN
jgi:hypothetical protein